MAKEALTAMRHHVAIMRKSWGFIPKIVAREKVIESRWLRNRSAPWNRVGVGDTVWFKNAGESVTARAWVTRVRQFDNLTPVRVRTLLSKYGKADGIERRDIPKFYAQFKSKRYCVLVFLERAVRVTPFDIDKRGFGSMAAWLTAPDMKQIAARRDVGR